MSKIDKKSKNLEKPSLLVRFKFEGEKKGQVAKFTYEQYSNMKEIPMVIECKIVKNQKITLSEKDLEAINKKIAKAFSETKSHTKLFSEN